MKRKQTLAVQGLRDLVESSKNGNFKVQFPACNLLTRDIIIKHLQMYLECLEVCRCCKESLCPYHQEQESPIKTLGTTETDTLLIPRSFCEHISFDDVAWFVGFIITNSGECTTCNNGKETCNYYPGNGIINKKEEST